MSKYRLRDLREDADLTQAELAKKLYMHTTQYRRYEAEERDIPLSVAKQLAYFFNVSIDYIAGIESTPKTLDGKPYTYVSQNGNNGFQINNFGNGSINMNERKKK